MFVASWDQLRVWSLGLHLSGVLRYWREELQDDWYRNLPVGSGNCVYFSNNGRWFYDICQRPYRWACEKELNKVG